MALKLNSNDYKVLERYAKLLEMGVANPMKKAIIEVYEYDKDDPSLPQKVWQRKRRLAKTEKLNELFAVAGVDKLKIAAKIASLMDAETPVVFHGKVMKDEKDEIVTVPELKVQLAAVTLASNIMGITQKQKSTDIGQQVNNLVVFIEDEKDARKRIAEEDAAHEVIKKSYEIKDEIEE